VNDDCVIDLCFGGELHVRLQGCGRWFVGGLWVIGHLLGIEEVDVRIDQRRSGTQWQSAKGEERQLAAGESGHEKSLQRRLNVLDDWRV
jgi:hypothetical protein